MKKMINLSYLINIITVELW